LRAWGPISSPALLVLATIALAAATAWLAAAAWKRSRLSRDRLFDDLMLWGWARRWRFERLLAEVPALASSSADDELSVERRARVLRRLSRALEARDPHTHGHSRRVARNAVALAKWMSLPSEQVARIRTAAMLHDVGKIETPREVLEKREPLTDREYDTIKRHATLGAEMVSSLGDPELTAIVRHHHERVDGGGYPDGLAGEEIPLGARIVAVADTFDAITCARPYRAALSHKQALALIDDEAGTQLDARAAHAFRSRYSGTRPVALCAGFLTAIRQLVEMLAAQLGPAAASKGAAVAAATVVGVGGSIALSQHAEPRHGTERPVTHGVAAPPRSAPNPASGSGRSTSPGTRPEPTAAEPVAVPPVAEPVSEPGQSEGAGGGSEPAAETAPAAFAGAPPTPPVAAPTPAPPAVEPVLESVSRVTEQITSAPPPGGVDGLSAG
jgi:putative nucleotidyltransferase with HDIG domain